MFRTYSRLHGQLGLFGSNSRRMASMSSVLDFVSPGSKVTVEETVKMYELAKEKYAAHELPAAKQLIEDAIKKSLNIHGVTPMICGFRQRLFKLQDAIEDGASTETSKKSVKQYKQHSK